MLFSRATVSHFIAWMKLPAGARLSTSSLPLGSAPPILPKRSRLFTTAVLVATAAVFYLPHSNEAVSTVRATWLGYYSPRDFDQRALEKLAARAEKENDARTLAFVGLITPNSEEGTRLANKAVSLDPSLTWIYASRFYRPREVPQPPEWFARLHSFDPGNAFIYLTAADAVAQPRITALLEHHTPAPAEIEAALVSDPQWVAQMEAAFRAPRYDDYVRKHWELICYEWNRDPALSPAIIGHGLWSHRIPNTENLKIFANFEIHRAQQALADGHPDLAAGILQQIDGFAGHMSEQAETPFERMSALELSRQSAQEFKNLYSTTGRAREASEASARLKDIENRKETFFSQPYLAQSDSLRREATLFHTFGILLFACGVMVALSFFILELRPRFFPRGGAVWQRILCGTADYAPVSFLILSLAFLMSFLPIAHLFARYRSTGASIETFREISGTLWGLREVPERLQFIFDPPFFWLLLTVALVGLAVVLLFRLFSRTRPAPQTAR
jgi:hypothetical protein